MKAINSRSENQEIMEFGVRASEILKSGFYYTKLKQKKSIKILNLLFKYNFTIHDPEIAIIIYTIFVWAQNPGIPYGTNSY